MDYKLPITYTPNQVAEILQLSKNTVYKLIDKGEIKAKKYGSVYRIPAKSISFALTGLDYDLLEAQQEDQKNLDIIEEKLKEARKELWG